MKTVLLALILSMVAMAEDVGTQSLIDGAVNHDKLYSGVEKYQDTTITNAQIIAMSVTPITVVSAPAAGYANVLTGVALWLDAGTTAIALHGSLLELRYSNAAGAKVLADGVPAAFTEATADSWHWAPAVSVAPVSVAAVVIRHGDTCGQSIVTTSGNSIKVRAFYRSLKTNILSQY